MLELIEGKIVTVRNCETKTTEMGIVKRAFGKLVVVVKRNGNMINLTPESLVSFYDVYLHDEQGE